MTLIYNNILYIILIYILSLLAWILFHNCCFSFILSYTFSFCNFHNLRNLGHFTEPSHCKCFQVALFYRILFLRTYITYPSGHRMSMLFLFYYDFNLLIWFWISNISFQQLRFRFRFNLPIFIYFDIGLGIDLDLILNPGKMTQNT